MLVGALRSQFEAGKVPRYLITERSPVIDSLHHQLYPKPIVHRRKREMFQGALPGKGNIVTITDRYQGEDLNDSSFSREVAARRQSDEWPNGLFLEARWRSLRLDGLWR